MALREPVGDFYVHLVDGQSNSLENEMVRNEIVHGQLKQKLGCH